MANGIDLEDYLIQEHLQKNRNPRKPKIAGEKPTKHKKTQGQRRATRIQPTPRPDKCRGTLSESQPARQSSAATKIPRGNRQPSKHYLSQTPTTRRHVSGGASGSRQDMLPLDGAPRECISCQGNDTWARRPTTIKKTSCRGQGHVGRHTLEWCTSQGQGHLHARTPDEGAHFEVTDTLRGARDLCDDWVLIPVLLDEWHQSRT